MTTDGCRPDAPRLAFIGFGEAARAFVEGFVNDLDVDLDPTIVRAFDVKTDGAPEPRAAMIEAYGVARVDGRLSIDEALERAEIVFSTVTADQAVAAAGSAAKRSLDGALYLDCNSCAPARKRAAAAMVDAAGGRYVDAAVMAPVRPKRHRAPLLLSGPHADAALDAARRLGMVGRVVEGEVGAAAAIKLCRSIMVKGMEALAAEMTIAARALGVDDAVLASLEASTPEFDWRAHADYARDRMTKHGLRRAAEMREAAEMLANLGLEPGMAAATAAWQQSVGALGDGREATADCDALDALSQALESARRG